MLSFLHVSVKASLWHHEEDGHLASYQQCRLRADRGSTFLVGALPRATLLFALLSLLPALSGSAPSPWRALCLGVVLWAQRSFVRFTLASLQVAEWLESVRRVSPLFRTEQNEESRGAHLPVPSTPATRPLFPLPLSKCQSLTCAVCVFDIPPRANLFSLKSACRFIQGNAS